MRITKEVLDKAKEGMQIIKKNEKRNSYIKMRELDNTRIDYIVERGNTYYCAQNDDRTFVFWDGINYGFMFSDEIFL